MAERSVEDVVTGILHVSVGGVVKELPTLKAKYIAEWGRLLGASGDSSKPISDWTMQDVAGLAGQTVERLLDLVVAYDRSAALGGREWLAENADPTELHGALVAMAGNAFPLADDPAALVGLMIVQSAVALKPPNSTNGASPNGASTRKRSARASIRSS
jgi:hypothetical protein